MGYTIQKLADRIRHIPTSTDRITSERKHLLRSPRSFNANDHESVYIITLNIRRQKSSHSPLESSAKRGVSGVY